MMRVINWFYGEKPLNTAFFESQSHSDTLLLGLDALRSKGQLLDVTLYVQGLAFQAHRAVLAACSDYFRAMFTDEMLESKQSEIRLNGVTAEGIRLLLDYAYTSRLGLNLANIQDVLSAASHVQMVAVVEACSSYLQAQLDLENCVDIVTIAETYSLNQLRNKVYRFISGHLQEFSGSNEFYRLSPQQLEHLLACDFPVDCRETEVLKIVIRWLRYHDNLGYKQRLSYATRFLRHVHLSELTKWEIESILQKSFTGANRQDQQLYCHIIRDACHQVSLKSNSCDISKTHNLINSRGMELAIVKVGGFGINGITNEITYFLPSKGKWKRLTMIPHLEQCNFGTAVFNNELYVVGGCFNQSLQENIHPFGFRYSPRFNKWMTMAPMQRERCRFSLNVVSDHLYAVGGASEADNDVDEESLDEYSAVERYDPSTDCWQPLRSLPGARAQHAGCAWPPMAPDRLIVSGGLEGDIVLSSVRCYNTTNDTWECLASMITPRADHAMLAIGDKIYVCGGWFEDLDTGNRVLVNTIDAYDVNLNSWEVVTDIPTPRYHAGIVSVGTKIYLIGGFHSDAMFDRATAAIECYDITKNLWSTDENYPQEIWEHACVTLYIPKCREDMDVLSASPNPNLNRTFTK